MSPSKNIFFCGNRYKLYFTDYSFRSDKRVNEWKTPGKKTIVKCAVNHRQGGQYLKLLIYSIVDKSIDKKFCLKLQK